MKCLKTILLWGFFSYAKRSFGDISNFLFQSLQCTLHTYVCDFLQNILFVEYISSHNLNVCRLGSFCFKPRVFDLYQRTTFSLNDLGYQGIWYTRSCMYMYLLNARSWFEKGYYSIGLCSGTWYLTITSCSLRSLGGHQINHQISLILSNMILCCYYMYLSFILEKNPCLYTALLLRR